MKTTTPKATKKTKPEPKGRAKTCAKPTPTSTKVAPEMVKPESNLSQPAPKPTLTVKQALFVTEYLVDLNATQAAIRAGYSAKTAKPVGSRLMTYVAVKAAVDTAIEERKKRVLITADDVIRELALIGFADMKDFIEIDEGGAIRAFSLEALAEGKSRIIKKVKEKRVIRTTKGTEDNPDGDQILDSTYEFELCDKVKSLELLSRHLGLLHDKQEIDVKQPLTVITKNFYRGTKGTKDADRAAS